MQNSFKVDPNIPHKITIKADGYEDKVIELPVGEYGLKKVCLISNAETVFVTLQMGKEKYSDCVKMKSSNKLFYPLKEIDSKNKILQVKPSLFSLRNMVLVFVLFLVCFLLVRFACKGEIMSKQSTTTTDTTEVTKDRDDSSEQFQTLLKNNRKLINENEKNKQLLSLYGQTLGLIKEKISINSGEVVDIIGKDEYKDIINGQEIDSSKLTQLYDKINNVNRQSTNHNNVNDGVNRQSEEDITLEDYLKNNNNWDLNKIQRYGKDAKNFVVKIESDSHDFNTLMCVDSSVSGLYIQAQQNNVWLQIVVKAKKYCGEDMTKKVYFMDWMNASPQKVNGILYLDKIMEYFD